MLFNKKISRSSYTDFMKCVIICALALPVLSFIGAAIANALNDPTAAVGTVSLIALILCALVCGAVCTRVVGGELKIPLLSALFVTLIMMIIGLISNRGALPSSAVMNYICYFGVFALASLLLRKRKSGRVRKIKRR